MCLKSGAFVKVLPERMLRKDYGVLNDNRFQDFLGGHERWHVQEYFDDLRRGDDPTRPRQQWHIEYVSTLPQDKIPIDRIELDYILKDVDGHRTGKKQQVSPDGYGQLWVSATGFEFEERPSPQPAPFAATVRFMVVLKTAEGLVERKYSASVKTPPGDAERFQITVTADRSCFVSAVFQFYFDNQVLYSKPFDLAVWRPRGTPILGEDGSQFVPTADGWRLAGDAGLVEKSVW